MKRIIGFTNFVIILAVLTTPPVFASCKSLSTQPERDECAQDKYKKEEQKLNKLVEKIFADQGIDQKSKDLIDRSLLKWHEFKNYHCTTKGDMLARDRAMESAITTDCQTDLTKEHIKRLENLFEVTQGL